MRAHWIAFAFALTACDSEPPRASPSMRCVGCHRVEYERAHLDSRRGTKPATCSICHSETSWHRARTRHVWPLTGAHADTGCADCHKGANPTYEGTSARCVSCHRADFDGVRNQRHQRYALTCATCHSTDAWKPAERPESERNLPPDPARPKPPEENNGAHTPTRPSTPSHTTRPTTTTQPTRPTTPSQPTQPVVEPPPVAPPVEPSEPEHPESRFPISRGRHANITCRRCHSRGGENTRDNTDCVQCHPRSRYDRVHDGVSSYPGSTAANFCVRCHTRGTRSHR